MNVSAISSNESNARKNLFIKYANQYMSFRANQDGSDTTPVTKPDSQPVNKINKSMGIETLTIFPKQVIDGRTIITA